MQSKSRFYKYKIPTSQQVEKELKREREKKRRGDGIDRHHNQKGQIVKGAFVEQHQCQQEKDHVKIGKHIGPNDLSCSG